MKKFTTSVEIARSVEDVFEYVSESTNAPEWNSAVLKVTKLTEGQVREGTEYRMERKLPGGDVENTLEVVELNPNREFAVRRHPGRLRFVSPISSNRPPMALELLLRVKLYQKT